MWTIMLCALVCVMADTFIKSRQTVVYNKAYSVKYVRRF